ncbi:MAG TPA: hypothetical protein VGF69_19070 [Thermoanaerobaculia bacterium]|jgi:antitoxin (DNA-binding transcriptional repressor) of toxin-antitoxin stability system
MTKTVTAADAQEHFLSLLDELAGSREEMLVTRDGEVVAKVVPLEPLPREALLGTLTFHEDIVAPIEETWNAEQ